MDRTIQGFDTVVSRERRNVLIEEAYTDRTRKKKEATAQKSRPSRNIVVKTEER